MTEKVQEEFEGAANLLATFHRCIVESGLEENAVLQAVILLGASACCQMGQDQKDELAKGFCETLTHYVRVAYKPSDGAPENDGDIRLGKPSTAARP